MDNTADPTTTPCHKAGRPRRGTEAERNDALMNAATRVFLKEGFVLASIDKVASEAGVSTRTIYERFKNKADLLAAVINRLIDRDMAQMCETSDLDQLDPQKALTRIGETLVSRFSDPDSAALYRIVVTEASRFPDLAARVHTGSKARLRAALAAYLEGQNRKGALVLADPARAAVLFMQMISAEMQECLLFQPADSMATLNLTEHVARVVHMFLFGAAPRADRPVTGMT